MSNINEKIFYLKGLIDGFKIDESTDEGKIYQSIISIFEDMGKEIKLIKENQDVFEDLQEDLIEHIETIQDEFDSYVDSDDDDDDDFFDLDDDEDDDYDDDEVYDFNSIEDVIECGTCRTKFYLTDNDYENGKARCPQCKTDINLGCDCGDCDGCE